MQTETAPKSRNWQAPGATGSPYLESRCIFCKTIRKGVAGRLVDHIVGEKGTALCGGPQREKDETPAKFNERLKEYKDAKEGFIKEREKKRSTKASVEMFLRCKNSEKKEFSKANISSLRMNSTLIFCMVANNYMKSKGSRSLINKKTFSIMDQWF